MFADWRRSNEKFFYFVSEPFFLFLSPAHQSSAHRNRHRNHEKETYFSFHAKAGSAGELLEHSLVHSDAGLEILQRKIFIRRMGPAILQRKADQ